MDQVLHLAIITNDHFRAEALARVTQELKWQLTPCVGQPDPQAWLRRRNIDLALVDLEIPGAIALLKGLSNAVPDVPFLG